MSEMTSYVRGPRSMMHCRLPRRGISLRTPHFRRGDHNERKVRNLIKNNLEDEQNSIELPCLIGAMEDEPLYQQLQEQLEQTSSEAPRVRNTRTFWKAIGRTSSSMRVRSRREDSLSLTSPRTLRSSVVRRPISCSARSSLGHPRQIFLADA